MSDAATRTSKRQKFMHHFSQYTGELPTARQQTWSPPGLCSGELDYLLYALCLRLSHPRRQTLTFIITHAKTPHDQARSVSCGPHGVIPSAGLEWSCLSRRSPLPAAAPLHPYRHQTRTYRHFACASPLRPEWTIVDLSSQPDLCVSPCHLGWTGKKEWIWGSYYSSLPG